MLGSPSAGCFFPGLGSALVVGFSSTGRPSGVGSADSSGWAEDPCSSRTLWTMSAGSGFAWMVFMWTSIAVDKLGGFTNSDTMGMMVLLGTSCSSFGEMGAAVVLLLLGLATSGFLAVGNTTTDNKTTILIGTGLVLVLVATGTGRGPPTGLGAFCSGAAKGTTDADRSGYCCLYGVVMGGFGPKEGQKTMGSCGAYCEGARLLMGPALYERLIMNWGAIMLRCSGAGDAAVLESYDITALSIMTYSFPGWC